MYIDNGVKKPTPKVHRKRVAAAVLIIAVLLAGLILAVKYSFGGLANPLIPAGAICLDAGHGGTDVGAVSGDRYEKDDVLLLTLEVERVLKQQGQSVFLTRTDDSTVSLEDRTKYANRQKAAVFVSIHRNSGSGNGAEVWVHSDKPEQDVSLATSILNQLEGVGISNNRGVKSGYRNDNTSENYWVNSHTDMPSCLVELGFMQSEEDNALFDENYQAYAKGIAAGIMESLGDSFDEGLYTKS